MAWRALDSAIRIAEQFRLKSKIDQWKVAKEAIRSAVLSRGYNASLNSFTRVFDGNDLDGSLLAVPLVGFIPATDPRMLGTIEAVRRSLGAGDLVYRLRPKGPSVYASEGAFLACSFWLVGSLALAGRLGEARGIFDQLVGRSNDLGLLSEEIDPASGEFLGNYPQGLSHVGLISAGLAIREAERTATAGAGRTSPG